MSDNPIWHMRRALKLAEKGHGFTAPNPMVGAVLVKNGEKIGEGYHHQAGQNHAEVEAIQNCTESTEGATLYVTLEPCCHQGKTPPCVKAIIEAGIAKVIVAVKDPSKKVDGQGIAELQAAGIEVEVGLMEEEARRLNRHFFTFHEEGRPYITLKWAQGLDAKIGISGEKLVLSGEPALNFAHALRAEHQAILVGAGTVLNDDPELTVRRVPGRNPIKVIMKGERNLPESLQIFQGTAPVILEKFTVQEAIEELKQREIQSILIEGGATLLQAFINANLWDEAWVIVCPKYINSKGISAATFPKPFRVGKSSNFGKDTAVHLLNK